MNTERIAEMIAVLKTMSDPLAHDLLDSIGTYMNNRERDLEKFAALADPSWSAAGGSFRADLPENVTRIGVSR